MGRGILYAELVSNLLRTAIRCGCVKTLDGRYPCDAEAYA